MAGTRKERRVAAAQRRLTEDGAATATPAGAPSCEPAPLPPTVSAFGGTDMGAIHEIYYDDATSYLGFVGARSAANSDDDCSTDPGEVDEDRDFDARIKDPDHHGAVGPTHATGASPDVKAATAEEPGARFRHDVYGLRVMPPWAYQYMVPPASADEPATEVAPGDAGAALMEDIDSPEAPEVHGRADHHHHDHHHNQWAHVAYGHAYGDAYASDAGPGVGPAGASADPDGDDAADDTVAPAAAAAGPSPHRGCHAVADRPASGVMCCYFKQGHCSMGASCWYAHYGDAATPCHYGASCRKGHRNLVRSHAAPPVPKEPASAAAVPKRYVHEPKPQRPSAPVIACPDLACPHCEAVGSVRTQDFPLFEGNRARTATRGHCGACMRTFMVA